MLFCGHVCARSVNDFQGFLHPASCSLTFLGQGSQRLGDGEPGQPGKHSSRGAPRGGQARWKGAPITSSIRPGRCPRPSWPTPSLPQFPRPSCSQRLTAVLHAALWRPLMGCRAEKARYEICKDAKYKHAHKRRRRKCTPTGQRRLFEFKIILQGCGQSGGCLGSATVAGRAG